MRFFRAQQKLEERENRRDNSILTAENQTEIGWEVQYRTKRKLARNWVGCNGNVLMYALQ
jgi:hypothetical protein